MNSVQVMDPAGVGRALHRIAHEIVERNQGIDGLALFGIPTRGVPLARRIAAAVAVLEQAAIPVDTLDIGPFRDDLKGGSPSDRSAVTSTADPTGRLVVLVDDVLHTGRTVRAALDALTHLGRPRTVQLAALIDRGHRELPIRADYIGKNLPTARSERVNVRLEETDGEDGVWVVKDIER